MYALLAGGGELGEVRLLSSDRVKQIGEEQKSADRAVLSSVSHR